MPIRVAGARLVLREREAGVAAEVNAAEAGVAAATWVVARAENREVRILGFIAGKSDEGNDAMP